MIAHGAKKVRYTVYPGVGHDMWNHAPYEKAWPDWIFNFSKSDTFSAKPEIPLTLSCTVRSDFKSFNVIWNNANNRSERKNKLWYYKVFRNDTIVANPDYSLTTIVDKPTIKMPNIYKIVGVNYDFLESDTSNAFSIELPTDINLSGNITRELFLYPNPSNDMFNIKFRDLQKQSIIEIYSTDGRKVINKTVQNVLGISIDMSSYAKGIYIIKFTSDGKNFYEKASLK
jgi:hypothetical protein